MDYQVRARAPESVPSDPVVFRTKSSDSDVRTLTTYRISERCTNKPAHGSRELPCQPDYLSNHDSGSLKADMDFVMIAHNKLFYPAFNDSVITRYCVDYSGPFADYLSCFGLLSENYTCGCNNFIDRCIGRLSIDSCSRSNSSWMPECSCSSASLRDSFRFVGRMPVFFPFPSVNNHNVSCDVAPVEESTFMGHWYSMPASAACASGSWPLPGGGCTWARSESQHFVHGFELAEKGFSFATNQTSQSDFFRLLDENVAVVNSVFDAKDRVSRCCGC